MKQNETRFIGKSDVHTTGSTVSRISVQYFPGIKNLHLFANQRQHAARAAGSAREACVDFQKSPPSKILRTFTHPTRLLTLQKSVGFTKGSHLESFMVITVRASSWKSV